MRWACLPATLDIAQRGGLLTFCPPHCRKEVKQYMRSIIRILAAAALVAVLMASSASPAFAGGYSHWWQDKNTGTANETDGVNGDGNKGWHTGPGYGWGSR
jgi:hypothetical protein